MDQESESIVHSALMDAMKGRTVLIIANNDATIKLASKVARIGPGTAAGVGAGAGAGSRTLEVLPTATFFLTGGVAPQA